MTNGEKIDYKNLPDEYWQKTLSREQYYVCRQEGTESAFSGEYHNHYEEGVYNCSCCGGDLPLFKSEDKYDSGTGWPSFHKPYKQDNIELVKEAGLKAFLYGGRVEVTCARCGSHLGHVFDDGPVDKSGKRFCINSIALKFIPSQK